MKIPGFPLLLIFHLYVVAHEVTGKDMWSRRELPWNAQQSFTKSSKTLPFSLKQCNEKPDVPLAQVTCDYSGCEVQCGEDYRMKTATGSQGVKLNCDRSSGQLTLNGKPWNTQDVHCAPYCGILGCLHGGVCTEPYKCRCQPYYEGDHCERPPLNATQTPSAPVVYPQTCEDPEFPVINAEVTRDGEQLLVRCSPGHQFSIGGTVAFIQCRAGRWDYPRGIFTHGALLMCQEMRCYPPCRNGGTCLPGGVCDCPYKYRGPSCGNLRCTVPNVSNLAHASMGGTSSRMKIQCHPGYTMLTNRRSQTLLCRNGLWVVPHRGYLVDIDVRCYANDDQLASVKKGK